MPDNEASKSRSATFQSIKAAVLSRDKDGRTTSGTGGSSRQRPLKRWYDENLQQRRRQIVDLLQEASGGTISQGIIAKVSEAVNHAAELALDVGAQTAEVSLYRPRAGEAIVIGERFAHYQDGDSVGSGRRIEVGLVTSPGLQRIGDGREDMGTVKVIVPALVYPR